MGKISQGQESESQKITEVGDHGIHIQNLKIFDKFGIFGTCRYFWQILPKRPKCPKMPKCDILGISAISAFLILCRNCRKLPKMFEFWIILDHGTIKSKSPTPINGRGLILSYYISRNGGLWYRSLGFCWKESHLWYESNNCSIWLCSAGSVLSSMSKVCRFYTHTHTLD